MSTTSDTAAYVLGLADDALVYSHRLGEWVARAPQIEEDLALANIGLDLLGQARRLLTRVGELDGTGRDEDELAYFRDEREFRCVHLVEAPRSDFGFEIARLLWFASYQVELYDGLRHSVDPVVAGVAATAAKEVAYHRDHASQWVLRLGDGTDESHLRMQQALVAVAPYVPELFADDAASVAAAQGGVGVRPSTLWGGASAHVQTVVRRATLELPEPERMTTGGRAGIHSTPMGFMLAEMQHLARSHPGAVW